MNHVPLWRKILRSNFTRIDDLVEFLSLDEEKKCRVLKRPKFVLNLPLRLASKIQKNDLEDPILKQFLPLVEETLNENGFLLDPVGDAKCRPSPKMLHKYQGRVLLVTTSACAMHCRYCFRQNFDYDKEQGSIFQKELEYIAEDETISEVILSGGDPLSLSNEILEKLIQSLNQIKHVKRLRFHTRFPVGIPERIDEDFVNILKKSPLQTWFVLHINHPNELGDDLFSRLKMLQKNGVMLLNQSVLLKGVNDDVKTLVQLSKELIDQGILPYYLHQLDRVIGANHFEVEETFGKYLIQEMAKELPGYAVPKYVREISGEPNKTNLF